MLGVRYERIRAMDQNISQTEIEETFSRLNQACLHATKNGNLDTRMDSQIQINEYLEWFRDRGIPVYTDTENACYMLVHPQERKETPLIERHRVVADGVLAYEGGDSNVPYCILLDYLSHPHSRNVLYQVLKQEVPAGADQNTLDWAWTIQGADHANALEEAQ